MSKRRFGAIILVTLALAMSLVCSTVPQTSDPVPLIISEGADGIATVTPEYNVSITPPIVVDANTTFTDVVHLYCPAGYNDTIGIANLTLNSTQIRELQIFVNYTNQKIILIHYQDGAVIQNITFALCTNTEAIMGITIIPAPTVTKAGPIDPISYNIVCTYEATLVYDVAVTNVVPSFSEAYHTWGDPHYDISVNVTVLNNGTVPINCTVATYYNASAWHEIGTQNVTLAEGANTTLTFNWNLTVMAPGNYTVKANATLIDLDDTYPNNNEKVDGQVKIRPWGDINDNGVVGMLDFADVGLMYLIYSGFITDPEVVPWGDLNGNGVVGMLDFADVGLMYLIYSGFLP